MVLFQRNHGVASGESCYCVRGIRYCFRGIMVLLQVNDDIVSNNHGIVSCKKQ